MHLLSLLNAIVQIKVLAIIFESGRRSRSKSDTKEKRSRSRSASPKKEPSRERSGRGI